MVVTQRNCSKCNRSHPLGEHFYPIGEWDAPEVAENDIDRCYAQRIVAYIKGSRIVKKDAANRCQFQNNHYSPHQCPPVTLSNGEIWRGEWWDRENTGLNDGNYTMDRPKR